MGRLQRNKRALDLGFAEFRKAREEYILKSLEDAAEGLLAAVAQHREFQGFTGNTQTSYACGIYVGGTCKKIILQENWNEPPRRVKVPEGKSVYLDNPYEGEARFVRGKMGIPNDGGFGQNTSVRFLAEYKDCPKDGYGLVITTGTEYSEYLENVRHLDVLTGTADDAARIISQNFKPMGKEWT